MKLPAVFVLVAASALASGAVVWRTANHHSAASAAETPSTAAATTERKVLFYRSPMHPWITSDKPGKCSICGMALSPVYEGDPAAKTDGTHVKLGDVTASVIGVETTPAKVAPLLRTLRVAGVISDDETRHRVLSARVPGRIEKLHVNQVGLEVVRDQPLATIYSPDVLTAQRLYLENLRVGTGLVSASELASSREKLLALGLVEEDIRRLEESKKPDATLIVRTPFDGTIISRGKANEGQYVNVNDELFEIGDFATLWFIFDAYERDLPALALNQKVNVTLPSQPGETITAPIEFIDPNLNESSRTARVRVVLPNPKRRILYRQTANGLVHIETAPALLIPRSALLFTHEQPTAYVEAGDGTYQPRQLKLGKIGDTDAEILDGIKEGERVVTQAALLIDSQAELTHISSGTKGKPAEEKAEKQAHAAHTPQSAPTHAPVADGTDAAHDHAHHHAAAPQSVPLPPALIQAALDATVALSSDDLSAYRKNLPALKAAIHKASGSAHDTLAPLAEKLTDGTDLKSARAPFEPFSNALAALVRAEPEAQRQAKIFQCRMSPVLGTALWLQKDATETRNPFFGSEMYHCGAELK
jgi:Cu(I)/Ag(I) efflux system membrane fusion protein